MENSVLDPLDDNHKKSTLDSIVSSKDAYALKLEVENKILAEYKAQFDNQRIKCLELEEILNKHISLINALSGEKEHDSSPTNTLTNLHKQESPVPIPKDLPEPNPVSGNDYIITSKKKLQYPSSPKLKLQELVGSTNYFKSDKDLHNMLCYAFDLPNIPMKTVQNYLLELQEAGVVKRVKSKKIKQFVTGLVEWFDEFGVPKRQHLKDI